MPLNCLLLYKSYLHSVSYYIESIGSTYVRRIMHIDLLRRIIRSHSLNSINNAIFIKILKRNDDFCLFFSSPQTKLISNVSFFKFLQDLAIQFYPLIVGSCFCDTQDDRRERIEIEFNANLTVKVVSLTIFKFQNLEFPFMVSYHTFVQVTMALSWQPYIKNP